MEKLANKLEPTTIFNRSLLIIILAAISIISAVGQDNIREFNVSSPKEYKIAGLTVDGVKHSDPKTIKLLSGLKEGDLVQVPGDDISNATNF